MARVNVTTDSDESMPLNQVPEDGRARVAEKKVWRLRSLFETDLRKAFEYLDDLRTHEAWRYMREPDMDRLMENRCLISPAFVEQLRRGYATLKKSGRVGKITAAAAARALAAADPSLTQTEIAKQLGVSKQAVHKSTKSCELQEKVDCPEWMSDRCKATFRKLSPADQERVRVAGRGSLRGIAIAAGIVKVASVLEQLRKVWAKATEADRRTFMDEVSNGW